MTKKRAEYIKNDWLSAQNDAQFADPSTLIEIVHFLARRAAERDFQSHKEKQERETPND
jgi:hypothetical protein